MRQRHALSFVLVALLVLGGYGCVAAGTAAPITIGYGQRLDGNLAVSGADTYSLNVSQGDVILIRMKTSWTSGPHFRVWAGDPEGTPLGQTTNSATDMLDLKITAPSAGNYTIIVDDQGNNQGGAYTLYTQRVNSYPKNPVVVDFGTRISSDLSVSEELDTYSFKANQSDYVLLRLDTNWTGGPHLRLYCPMGNLISEASSTTTSYTEISKKLPSNGTYTVVVGDKDGNQAGTYAYAVQRVNNPGHATSAAFGQLISADFAFEDELDTYTFQAAADDVVLLRQSTSWNGGPIMRLFAPNGSLIGGSSSATSPNVEISRTLPVDGTYTITVGDNGWNQAGPYTFYVQRLNHPGLATPIAFGQTVSASFDRPEELDTYSFEGYVNDKIRIGQQTAWNGGPSIRLYDPDGAQIAEMSGSSSSNQVAFEKTLVTRGTYTMVLGDVGWNNVGAYTCSLNLISRETPVPSFAVNRTSGDGPLAVQFTDQSSGMPTAWRWNFGDGTWFNTTDPAQANPTHTYTAPGTYVSRLTVCSAATCTTTAPGVTITVTSLPTITVTAPNGGESWLRGSAMAIQWRYSGTPGSAVTIELLKGGAVKQVIASSAPIGTAGAGSYTWTVPATLATSTEYSVRVTSTTNAAFTDSSDAKFAIASPMILVTAPDGGEVWGRGTPHSITWTYTGSQDDTVVIMLLKGSTIVTTITPSAPIGTNGVGSFTWTIPETVAIGSLYTIGVKSTSQASVKDTSDGTFSIVATEPLPSITVNAPDGGETWEPGSSQTIRWASTGIVGQTVTIDLLKAGVPNQVIASGVATSTGSYPWTVPASLASGSNYRVRITTSTPTVTDTSTADFAIGVAPAPAAITVTAPNGGESIARGQSATITWTYTGDPGSNVKIALFKGSTMVLDQLLTSSTPIGSDGVGSYTWTVSPTKTLGADYKVTVKSTTDATKSDTSNGFFSIVEGAAQPSIKVSAPNGGESVTRGETYAITWTYTGNPGSDVQITLLKGGTIVNTITASASIGAGGSGSYSWTVPATLTLGNDYTIGVKSTTLTTIKDTSDTYFSVVGGAAPPTPTIKVTAPNGGESWRRGSEYPITWTFTGNPGSDVQIMVLKGGTVVSTITSSTPIGTDGAGSYRWTIPSTLTLGSDYTIGVKSATQTTIKDTSDVYFSIVEGTVIQPSIRLTAPNGGETVSRGEPYPIAWSYTGDPGSDVLIVLLKGGTVISTIESSAPIGTDGTGSFSWTPPASLTPGSDYTIGVKSVTLTTIKDTSNSYFRIS